MALLMAEPIDRPLTLFGDPGERAPDGDFGVTEGDRRMGGGPTLDDAIVAAWEGLTAHGVVACPMCDGGAMRPVAAAAGGGRARGSDAARAGDAGRGGDAVCGGDAGPGDPGSGGGQCDRCGTTLI